MSPRNTSRERQGVPHGQQLKAQFRRSHEAFYTSAAAPLLNTGGGCPISGDPGAHRSNLTPLRSLPASRFFKFEPKATAFADDRLNTEEALHSFDALFDDSETNPDRKSVV